MSDVISTDVQSIGGGGDEQGRMVVKQYERLKTKRAPWETLWTDTARYCAPDYEESYSSMTGRNTGVAERNNKDLFISEGIEATDKLVSIMESFITPRGQRWHTLAPQKTAAKPPIEIRRWYDAVTDAIFKYRYAPEANYSVQTSMYYMSLIVTGTGAMFIDKHDNGGLRYTCIHMSQLLFDVNHQGIVDRVWRGPIRLSGKNAVEKFKDDEDKLPKEVKEAASDTSGEEKLFEFVHYVSPNSSYVPGSTTPSERKFKSCYVEKSSGKTVSESYYSTFPYVVSRWKTAPGELYGRSPAMDALPNLKTLNKMKKIHLTIGHREMDPMYLTHDEGLLNVRNMVPGGIVGGTLTAEGRALMQKLDNGNYQVSVDMMDREINMIQKIFMLDVFQLMADGEMTATEVIERSREKAAFLTPIFGRQESEGLGVQIPREIQLLFDQGLLPDPPEGMEQVGGRYEIIYDSPLSRAQRADHLAGSLRAVQTSMEMAANMGDPSLLDHFNFDRMIPEIALDQATPARYISTSEEVKQKREARQAQQDTQTAIQAAPAVASVVGKQGEA